MQVYDNDCKLPALPVPTLKETSDNLKMMIKPIVSEETWEKTCAAIDDFCAGEGFELQEKLVDWKAQLPANSSWLRPMWDDMCLSFRGSLPIFMNFDFQLEAERWGEDALAKLIVCLAQATVSLRSENLEPESSKDNYLSMDTLRSMFYTRIPNSVRDDFYPISLSASLTAAVVCKGNWFILSLTDECGKVFSLREIANALSQIHEHAFDEVPAIGALTCCDRDKSHALRSRLQENILNRTSFEQIEKALFVVCLDQPLAQGELFGNRTLGGRAENRWYDKSLQIICAGENIGVNFEHAGCDAGIWVYMLEQADALIRQNKLEQNSGKPHMRKLNWYVDEAIADELDKTSKEFEECLGRMALSHAKLKGLSKEIIKTKKCSPDAFVQLLFQAAYYNLTGTFRSVYESVATRFFYQGRTECIRACTEQSKAFILALADEKTEKQVLLARFSQAVDAHKRVMAICQNGKGSERHMTGLLAMNQMLGKKEVPAIFRDKGYLALKYDVLSTSSVTAPFIAFFGFGPVVEDGIGIGYGITPESLNIMVTSYPGSKINSEVFIEEIDRSGKLLLDIIG